MRKNLFSLITAGALVASLSLSPLSSYANENPVAEEEQAVQEENLDLSKKEVKEQTTFQESVAEELKEAAPEERDAVLGDLIADQSNVIKEKMEDENLTETTSVTLNDKDIESEFTIDENTTLEFNNDGVMLDVVEEGEEREATVEEENQLAKVDNTKKENTSIIGGIKEFFVGEKTYAAAASKTKNASHTRTVKSWYGTKLYTAKIAADFTYNGTKVTASRTTNYIKRHLDGAIYSVYNLESAVQKPSSKKRTAFQSGYVSWGLQVQGQGLVFEEKYIKVSVSSNEKGTITKSSMFE